MYDDCRLIHWHISVITRMLFAFCFLLADCILLMLFANCQFLLMRHHVFYVSALSTTAADLPVSLVPVYQLEEKNMLMVACQ